MVAAMTRESSGADDARDTHFGFRSVPEAEKQGHVDAVFDRVARRYDLMNDLMSGGLHRLWKDALIAWLAPPKTGAGWSVLDVAGGTGDIALRIAEAAPAAEITVLDINPNMLDVGEARARKRGLAGRLTFVEGNAEEIGLPDQAFDAYTIAFGIRNVTHIDRALAEAYRVLRPGGRFLCLEFSPVDMPMLDRIYDLYSFNVIPAMGRLVAGDAEPYRYLVESIRRFPDRETFAGMIEAAGFSRVSYRCLSGGIAVLHSGWRI
ncbi:demethylmenaquinone methyltransferase/2-methoxy-6-polyprenyl-1,4-benzoquinol methylase [Tepidamorphus gemmatus]|jgi:demethylmenaquinone methyltransferase/2-methoxy-6-polyprenyl-1,4-benzoquinol methylase|uniref:Ubiquinone/menaquinone biosynthesis C-methyltransferase UbiE n=2 Tax=Tepidamorphus gemmatus TaxID=747076 RepID=A0A4R3MJS0_9HYPH|nr:demethylmenaquinone methyltransferase/2-methoxy-6-polyprenyl-1,4-benzoquinol methylase [Tepidamorphus gemmatus]